MRKRHDGEGWVDARRLGKNTRVGGNQVAMAVHAEVGGDDGLARFGSHRATSHEVKAEGLRARHDLAGAGGVEEIAHELQAALRAVAVLLGELLVDDELVSARETNHARGL